MAQLSAAGSPRASGQGGGGGGGGGEGGDGGLHEEPSRDDCLQRC